MNTFGPSASEQYPIYDVRRVLESRTRFRRDQISNLERANSLYCSSGRWPSRGWILLARNDYNRINKYSTTLQLNISDTSDPNNVGTLKNLSIVQAQCVTRGVESDTNALYLVEVTDGRGVLDNKWFKFPINSQYNIRAPAYPTTFHPQSINGGTTWTWSTMLQNMWGQMSVQLGAWPGLPFAPLSTPEGFWFTGVPALAAMCNVLDHLGMTLACDLTRASPFTIVSSDSADVAFDALTTRFSTHLEDDLEWIDVGAGRVPGTVKVIFPKRYEFYGTEETVRRDSPQWNMTPTYTVTVSAPAAYASATGVHYIWSDFTVRHDMNGDPLAADVVTANSVAQERSDRYYDQILDYMSRTYSGALPFATGSQVDGVCWYQDYRSRDWHGWRTKVVRGPTPSWPDVWS